MRAGADSPAPRRGSQRFRACDRVRRRFEYRHVQSQGQRVHSPRFVWLVATGVQPQSRLGITVTKKVASAVGRNRIKRVLREAFRKHRDTLPLGIDLIAIAKRQAVDIDYATCCHELSTAAPAIARAARRLEAGGGTR